ncbi:glucose-6-phosphate dehydrogenase [Candidatus Berkelbacteria bacterium]|nr:glucose-6-phosphate dehydrogenase [Candidatus Berkelbacteria bacterium]
MRHATPIALVLFGATGDLAARKIVPALELLLDADQLPANLAIIGVGRRPYDDAAFRDHLATEVQSRLSRTLSARILKRLSYHQGTFEDPATYERLAERLRTLEQNGAIHRLFYVATPPEQYATIFTQLAGSGLTHTSESGDGWSRVLVEKPFGRDAASAAQLEELLGSLFREEQIYRIDHYLAKDILQGILSFRFSNTLLEPSWGGHAIEQINLRLLETIGVEARGTFYDTVGALRDVGQNHLLQMLALTTMECPPQLTADAIRDGRTRALEALRPPNDVNAATLRAQYHGYSQITGVAQGSTTETYFALRTTLTDPRWKGVTVTMEAGKRLGAVNKEIEVWFAHPSPCLCPPGHHYQNRVTLRLEPNPGIEVTFWTKRAGLSRDLEEQTLAFTLGSEGRTQYLDEYAQLLSDAIAGDQTLFISSREVAAMWRFVDPVLAGWAAGEVPLMHYAPDTDEPRRLAADLLKPQPRR